MPNYTLAPMEARFADLIWANAPIPSGQLVKLCEREFNWKKSTTYTVLRRLCQRRIFENKDGQVTVRLSREEFSARQSEEFVTESFGGSLPKFLTAFTRQKKLTEEEIAALESLIDASRKE